MSVVYKWQGSVDTSSMISLYDFLILHKNETFLKNMTITSTHTSSGNELKIIDGDSIYFRHVPYSDAGASTIQTKYTNGTTSITERGGNSYAVYPVHAILSNNGLLISYKNAANVLTHGATMLTTDSTGHLCCALRRTIYGQNDGYDINFCVSDSQTDTGLYLSPAFNSSMTGLVPVVASSASNTTTMPTFFVSAQTELPSLGLEVGAIDGQTYITNGYCFIRS